MKTKIQNLLLTLAVFAGIHQAAAQGTAFTYQGQLNVNGQPANGAYNLTFALFDAGANGNQIGVTFTNAATAVSNGLFTVTLDYGNTFDGSPRWLELGVQTNIEPFVILSPRQRITPAPYAIYTATAGSAATAGTANSAASAATATSATTATTAITANNFSGALSGDVTGTQGATVVSSVGGQTAANVANAASAANAATSANTAGAIVKRDASGNFAAGVISANFNGNGANITNLNAASLASGAIADARLSSNVSLLNGTNHFSGTNVFAGVIIGTNAGNIFNGLFTGNLSGNAATATTAGSVVPGSVTAASIAGGQVVKSLNGLSDAITIVAGTNMTVMPNGNTLVLGSQSDTFRLNGTNAYFRSGLVGIGTNGPLSSQLEIAGQDGLGIIGYQPFLTMKDSNSSYSRSRVQGVSGDIWLETENYLAVGYPGGEPYIFKFGNDGRIGIGTYNPDQKLTVAGTVHSTSGGFMFPDGTSLVTANGANAANAAASANTANAIVKRDASGNFSAGAVTAASFTGNGSGLTNVTAATLAIPPGMALIPAGAFTMGDTLDGETDAVPAVTITVSAFYMDANLVSYSQWQSVYYWAMSAGYSFDNTGAGKAANHPVQTVNWYDTIKWCNARSQQAGLTPVYYTDAGLTQIYTNGDTDAVYPNWAANGYRLPTEAEWEKAARGGLSGQRFPWGNTITENLANYYGNTSYGYDLGPNGVNAAFTSGGQPDTSPIGYFSSNSYGLYDMAGNVWEWCWDWYGTGMDGGDNYAANSTDPHGPASGSLRIFRGGGWGDPGVGLRCTYRDPYPPSFAYYNVGFRCVRKL